MNKQNSLHRAILGGINRTNQHVPTGTQLDALESINLIPKEGGLRPYIPHTPFIENAITPGREIVHVHEINHIRNFITKDSDHIYFEFQLNESNNLISKNITLSSYTTNAIIQTIGSTMIVVSSTKQYFLFKNDNYISLTESPDISVTFTRNDAVPYKSENSNVDLINMATPVTIGGVTYHADEMINGYLKAGENEGDSIVQNRDIIRKAINAAISKATGNVISGIDPITGNKVSPKFIHPHFIRAGIRLFDGNYLYYTNPVLINRYAIGNHSNYVAAKLYQTDYNNGELGGFWYNVYVQNYDISFTISFPDLNLWKDVIKGVDIFMSAPVYSYDIDGYTDSYNTVTDLFHLPVKSSIDFFKQLCTIEAMYKVKELDVVSDTYTSKLELKNNDLVNIYSLETMKEEYMSRHTSLPDLLFLYNSKLHSCGIKNSFFNGYKINDVNALNHSTTSFYSLTTVDTNPSLHKMNIYSNIVKIKTSTIIESANHSEIFHEESFAARDIQLPAFIYYPDSRATKQYITLIDSSNTSYSFEVNLKPHIFFNGAFCLSKYATELDEQIHTVDYNGDYYHTSAGGNPALPHTHANINTSEYIRNMMMVSATSNIFYFPVETIYRVGNGKIIGLGTPTQAISQGQFGQFPIYVFCSDGIYAGEVGASAYSSFHPVSRDIATSAKGIISIDNAVVFTTANGLMLLAGNDTKTISPQMVGETFELYQVATTTDPITSVVTNTTTERLRGLMQLIHPTVLMATDSSAYSATENAVTPIRYVKRFNQMLATSEIAYDYQNKRLYIIDSTNRSHTLVFDFATQSFVKIVTPFTRLLNAWPSAIGYDAAGNLYDLNQIINHEEHISQFTPMLYISRPIHFKDLIVKLKEFKINGFIGYNDQLPLFLYGSRRGDDYQLIRCIDISKTNFKVKTEGAGFKYYIFAIAARLTPNTVMSDIEYITQPTQTNKLR